MVAYTQITVPDDVRPDWEHLDVLEASLRTNGQLQAIGVKPEGGKFKLLWGHNRLQAANNLGWTKIRAAIREYDADDLRQELVVLDENLVKDELTCLEYAEALGRQREIYLNLYPKTGHGKGRSKQDPSFGSCESQRPSFLDDTSSKMGWSRSRLGNYIYLYRNLPVGVRDLIRQLPIADNFMQLNDMAHLKDEDEKLRLAHLLVEQPQMAFIDAKFQACPTEKKQEDKRNRDRLFHKQKAEDSDVYNDLEDFNNEENTDVSKASDEISEKTAESKEEDKSDEPFEYVDPLIEAIDNSDMSMASIIEIQKMVKKREYWSLDTAIHKVYHWLNPFAWDGDYKHKMCTPISVSKENKGLKITIEFRPLSTPDEFKDQTPKSCPGWGLFRNRTNPCQSCRVKKNCFKEQLLNYQIKKMPFPVYNEHFFNKEKKDK